MSAPRPFQIPRLYHFTDTRNLAKITEAGGLCSRRRLARLGVDPVCGGNAWSLEADAQAGMDHFVHLSFTSRHPMEYLAKKDGRIQESIYLEIDAGALQINGVLYTPGVSNAAGMVFMTMEEAVDEIDYEVLYCKTDWNDPAVMERRRLAEKCEILVPDFLPLTYITSLHG